LHGNDERKRCIELLGTEHDLTGYQAGKPASRQAGKLDSRQAVKLASCPAIYLIGTKFANKVIVNTG